MIVEIKVLDTPTSEVYTVGIVIPPAEWDEPFIHQVLNDLWVEWREENPHPDTDSEFVDWLVDPDRDGQSGWKLAINENIISHIIEV